MIHPVMGTVAFPYRRDIENIRKTVAPACVHAEPFLLAWGFRIAGSVHCWVALGVGHDTELLV
jgi:hypothetical protein